MIRIFLIFSIGFLASLEGEEEGEKKALVALFKNEELKKVNEEIKYLEDMKTGLEGRARRFENKAQRLQFNSEQLQEAKRYWKLADACRDMIKEIDEQLRLKKIKRKKLLEP